MRRSAGSCSRGKDGLGLCAVSRLGSVPARFRAENRPKLEAPWRRGERLSVRGTAEPPVSLPETGPSPAPAHGVSRVVLSSGLGRRKRLRRGQPGRRAASPCRVSGPRAAGARVADEWTNVLRSRFLLYTPANPLRETGTHSRAQIFFAFLFISAGKVELHGKLIEVEHSVPKRQRYFFFYLPCLQLLSEKQLEKCLGLCFSSL